MIHYCKYCTMPDTRPGSIFIDGSCLACINYKNYKKTNWDNRMESLKTIIADQKPLQSLIPVSGGKDSHFLMHLAKDILGLSPYMFRVNDAFTLSAEGAHNIKNLQRNFNAPLIEESCGYADFKNIICKQFKYFGNFPIVDALIYTSPIIYAYRHNVKLVIYGENPAFFYGTTDIDTGDASSLILLQFKTLGIEELGKTILKKLRVIFASYYVPWSGYGNYEYAKSIGFKELSYERTGNIENYDSIDSIGWQVSQWLKYTKFGFGRVADISSRLIREGRMTREEAVQLVRQKDGNLDPVILEDFLKLTGYNKDEFFAIASKWWNPDLFTPIDGEYMWQRKPETMI